MKTEPDDFAFSRADGVQARSFPGLTKREYFAGLAMQGIVANSIPGSHHTPNNMARDAIAFTDALIAELNKEPT